MQNEINTSTTSSTKVALPVPTTVEGSHLYSMAQQDGLESQTLSTQQKTPTTGPVANGIHQMSLSFSENAT